MWCDTPHKPRSPVFEGGVLFEVASVSLDSSKTVLSESLSRCPEPDEDGEQGRAEHVGVVVAQGHVYPRQNAHDTSGDQPVRAEGKMGLREAMTTLRVPWILCRGDAILTGGGGRECKHTKRLSTQRDRAY